MKEEIKLMKGNEAIAHAAIRYGADGYFGYPITPQSEILETLEELMPWVHNRQFKKLLLDDYSIYFYATVGAHNRTVATPYTRVGPGHVGEVSI